MVYVRLFHNALTIDIWMALILWLPCGLLLCYAICCRYWLFYFQTRLSEYEKNKDWRMAIDPIHESNNWYVQNHHKWGNDVFLLKFVLILTLFQSTVYWIVHFTNTSTIPIADAWLYLSYFIALLFGLCMIYKIKTESFRDNLGILKEIKVAGWFSVITIATMTVASFVFWIQFRNYYTLVIFYCFVIMAMGYMYITILYSKGLFDEYNNINSYSNIIHCCCSSRSRRATLRKNQLYLTQSSGESNIGGNVIMVTTPKNDPDTPKTSETSDNLGRKKINPDHSPRNLKKINRWTQVVGEYKWFVAFMNHLAKEFSTENLLFIQEVKLHACILHMYVYSMYYACFFFSFSVFVFVFVFVFFCLFFSSVYVAIHCFMYVQYVQIKHVLNQFLKDIMNEIYNEYKYKIKFDLDLPPTSATSAASATAASDEYIPESRISQELRAKFITTLNIDDNFNEDENDRSYANLHATITSIIIDAFRKLYYKYVDSKIAMFMINISSENRKSLTNLFRQRSESDDIDTYNNNNNNNNNITNDIENLLEKYIKETFTNENIEINDKQIIKWVLCKIMIPMETSVMEITLLLGDAFTRFKSPRNDVFQRLCREQV